MRTKSQLGERPFSPRARGWFTLGNAALLTLWLWNGVRMYRSLMLVRASLENPLLANEPEAFAAAIAATASPGWAWALTSFAVIVSAGLLAAWWHPALRRWPLLKLVNGLWLGGWALYVVVWLVVAIIVVGAVLRFT